MRLAMIGSGYVGLVSGACLADFGHEVACIDNDAAKIAKLTDGVMPIFEPGLVDLVASNAAAGRLRFSTAFAEEIRMADAVFITVGTPARRGSGHADLGFVYQVARDLAGTIDRFKLIVTKSTVPVGTGDEVERLIREANPKAEFAVASNPEFLREGSAIGDFKRPDRIVIGTTDPRAKEMMSELYRPLYLNQAPLMFTERRTAELIKYAANAFLATKITFINEIAELCEAVGANVQDVARGIGLDKRIGSKYLHAGPGYGGSCFPKDTQALIQTGEDFRAPLHIIETVVAVNDRRKRRMARKVVDACGGDVRGATIAILGLTFKPNTDDMREAPSLAIIAALQEAGARVRAYDPEGMELARAELDDVDYADSVYACVEGADALVIVTEWDMFRALDLKRVRALLKRPIVVDLRNIYPAEEMERHGFTYISVGRPPVGGDGSTPGSEPPSRFRRG